MVAAIIALHRMEQAYTIKRVDGGSNNGSLRTTTSQLIAGVPTKTQGAQNSAVTHRGDGANW